MNERGDCVQSRQYSASVNHLAKNIKDHIIRLLTLWKPMLTHILGDKLFLLLINWLGTPFFSGSMETATFEEHMDNTHVSLPRLSGSDLQPVPIQSLAGEITAGVRVVVWTGATAPTIIFHQGGGEIPFDQTISAAYRQGPSPTVNVIAVKTPFQTTQTELAESFVHFNNYVAMIASVVQTTEALIQSQDLAASSRVLVGGYSLGGFVSGRHHIIYNTADAYVPFVSGTAHAEIFLTTVRASKIARKQKEILRSRLNFTKNWAASDNSNVFPVLSRYDQLNRLAVQGPSYGDMALDIWTGGHLYGAKRPYLIRDKLESVLASL